MLKVSQKALARIKDLVVQYKEDNGLDSKIRIGVAKQGCSGIAYTMEHVVAPDIKDEIVSNLVCIAPSALMFTIDVLLDYVVHECSEGFEFLYNNTEKQRKSCHCGKAFYE